MWLTITVKCKPHRLTVYGFSKITTSGVQCIKGIEEHINLKPFIRDNIPAKILHQQLSLYDKMTVD